MAQIHPYTYKANLARVVDGDTYDFVLDLGFNIQNTIRVRIQGVDTNEIYGVKKESQEYARGKRQSEYARKLLESAEEIIVKTFKDDKGKYGHYIADVIVDGEDLADQIKEQFPHLK